MITTWILLATHFVADFICQTDAMAQGKSKSNYWLTLHVAVYSLVFLLVSALLLPIKMAFLFTFVNFVLHWITDYVTSRINSRLWQAKMVHWFFVGVGADQLVHYTCLLFTYEYISAL